MNKNANKSEIFSICKKKIFLYEMFIVNIRKVYDKYTKENQNHTNILDKHHLKPEIY
jgi:hypothetical protein